MISTTGVWSQEEADSTHAFSYTTARFISQYFEKDIPVIDIGCGKGTYLQYLKDMGFTDLTGVEGTPLNNFDTGNIKIMDVTSPIDLPKGNVISIEVFEHIPAEFEAAFIDNVVNLCNNKLVLSVAVEGQPGVGHVNCKNNDYVIKMIEARGFDYKYTKSLQIRELVEPHVAYLRNTLMIFEKQK